MSSVPTPFVVGTRRETVPASASAAERAQEAVTALYAERAPEFLHYAHSLGRNEELARDAVQEAFMRYFVALCQGEEIVSPRPWLYRVLHNYVLDRVEERRRDESRPIGEIAGRDADPERQYLQREMAGLVRHSLTAREYDCIRLRTEGLRYEEIATTLRVSSGTVGALISRAMRKLGGAVGKRPGEAHEPDSAMGLAAAALGTSRAGHAGAGGGRASSGQRRRPSETLSRLPGTVRAAMRGDSRRRYRRSTDRGDF